MLIPILHTHTRWQVGSLLLPPHFLLGYAEAVGVFVVAGRPRACRGRVEAPPGSPQHRARRRGTDKHSSSSYMAEREEEKNVV